MLKSTDTPSLSDWTVWKVFHCLTDAWNLPLIQMLAQNLVEQQATVHRSWQRLRGENKVHFKQIISFDSEMSTGNEPALLENI